MPAAAYTPSLPGLSTADEVDTVINWGLGADSTAYLARILTDPSAYGIDLERTAVLYMATGSEWPETRMLVEEFMLPLLREHEVRFVQLSRSGQPKAVGITVLDDSRRPERLFARGPWTLWDELESVGTVPQQAGTRKCSLRAKGEVGDRWLMQVMGGRPFRQIMGFNADEPGRRFGDAAASKIPGRTGVYPLIDWGWHRQQCENYLLERFGVHWPKSYCTFCCFPVSMGALPAHLERMRSHPDIAGEVLRLEYTAMSLNPNARLYGKRSLLELLDPTAETEPATSPADSKPRIHPPNPSRPQDHRAYGLTMRDAQRRTRRDPVPGEPRLCLVLTDWCAWDSKGSFIHPLRDGCGDHGPAFP
ncbi:hypothetical protein [Streptomyces werraensis]|uniref:hypothetical protein n=1 Tax=Streptomyces werraensis TaxID=68284 RepID=UPI0033B99190